jgi:hypothetical protein
VALPAAAAASVEEILGEGDTAPLAGDVAQELDRLAAADCARLGLKLPAMP